MAGFDALWVVQTESSEAKYLLVSVPSSLWTLPFDIFAYYDWDTKDSIIILKCHEKVLIFYDNKKQVKDERESEK